MIFICSQATDYSTTEVIKWLNYYNIKYIRYNEGDTIKLLNIISVNDFLFELESSKEVFKFSDITAYWYRRGGLEIKFDYIKNNTQNTKEINHYLALENSSILDFIESFFEENLEFSIGKRKFNSINKLLMLNKAKELDIEIPDTIITSSKSDVLAFYNKHKPQGIITKGIYYPLNINISNEIVGSFYTSEFTLEHINKLEETFYPTKFQEKLEKDFEIRTFFIDNKTYSSAIFSQADDQTKVDFRRYNFNKPNRTPPFKLPIEIEKQILLLMKSIGLNSGSIDMVYTKSKKFVFLEVNPIGQFQQVSHPCNYNIEKIIAKYLNNERA